MLTTIRSFVVSIVCSLIAAMIYDYIKAWLNRK